MNQSNSYCVQQENDECVGEVIGPHFFNLAYKTEEEFFDHVRPVKWLIEYEYENRKLIPMIEFQNTLRRIQSDRARDQEIWANISNQDFVRSNETISARNLGEDARESVEDRLKHIAEIQTTLAKETSMISRYKRNRELLEELKRLYDYRCQLCSSKSTDIPSIPMKNGINYVEVHHIKGFNEVRNIEATEQQDSADFDIDHYKNLITVRVYHHKLLHIHINEYSFDGKKFVSRDGKNKIELSINLHL
jgi:predicted HNH restriction endonuclease